MINERMNELVSPRVGLIREIAPQGRGADEPMPPFLYTATLSNFDFRVASRSDRMAAGKGTTRDEAIASAIGEATERYCAYHWDPERTFLAKSIDITTRSVTPQDCVLYCERQYATFEWPHPRWTPETELAWINGFDVVDGDSLQNPMHDSSQRHYAATHLHALRIVVL